MRAYRLIFVYLPCLRCGSRKVCFMVPSTVTFCEIPDLMCEDCGARHYLRIAPDGVEYKPDTRRYPSDNYDDNDFPVMKGRALERLDSPPDDDRPGFGPITIYPRKRYFSSDDLRQIYEQSGGRCGLCRKRWKLTDHGQYGWHIDHVVANAGGGWDTEDMANFQVSCARCNLKKGRGYTSRDIRSALQELVETCVTNMGEASSPK